MNLELISEYKRLRKFFSGSEALRAARINLAFEIAKEKGFVRLQIEPEIDFYDDSYIDTWEISEGRRERILKELHARINREGHWILVSQYLSEKGYWETADSIGGFIGLDWKDSGYDTDAKLSALIEAGISILNFAK